MASGARCARRSARPARRFDGVGHGVDLAAGIRAGSRQIADAGVRNEAATGVDHRTEAVGVEGRHHVRGGTTLGAVTRYQQQHVGHARAQGSQPLAAGGTHHGADGAVTPVLARQGLEVIGHVLVERTSVRGRQILPRRRPRVRGGHERVDRAPAGCGPRHEWLERVGAQVRGDGQRVGRPDAVAEVGGRVRFGGAADVAAFGVEDDGQRQRARVGDQLRQSDHAWDAERFEEGGLWLHARQALVAGLQYGAVEADHALRHPGRVTLHSPGVRERVIGGARVDAQADAGARSAGARVQPRAEARLGRRGGPAGTGRALRGCALRRQQHGRGSACTSCPNRRGRARCDPPSPRR